MGIDHSTSLLRITFHGLFIITRNVSQHRWEIGVPNLADHTFDFTLRRITGSPFPVTEQPNISVTDRQIFIRPDITQLTSLFDPTEFDRQQDRGDVNDYRWIINLEGPEFHDRSLRLRPDGVGYRTRIFVQGGRFYADIKTVENYRRDKVGNPDNRLDLYKLGLVAGINLPRVGLRSISIQNDDGQPTVLTPEQGIRYELRFTHTPPPDVNVNTVAEPHFRHYYMVLKDDDSDTQFEVLERNRPAIPLVSLTEHSHEREPKSPPAQERVGTAAPINNAGNPSGGGEPQVCNAIFLSRSQGLP
jgi:hypothetical protein